MKKGKTSLSNASSYREIGEFWSEHDVTDHWEDTLPAEFEVDIQEEKRYYPLERTLAEQVSEIAKRRGVAAETLLNLWVKEKVLQQGA